MEVEKPGQMISAPATANQMQLIVKLAIIQQFAFGYLHECSSELQAILKVKLHLPEKLAHIIHCFGDVKLNQGHL